MPTQLSPRIQNLVDNGLVSVYQAFSLDEHQIVNLESEAICGLIFTDVITLTEALELPPLNYNQRRNLESEAVRDLVNNETITLTEALGLNHDERRNLESEAVRDLVNDGTITLTRALGLNHDERRNLEDPVRRGMLINGDLTIDDIIEGPVQNHTPHAPNPRINDDQSTHHASVHKSVSASATKLMARYGSEINGPNLEITLRELRNLVFNLSDASPETRAAKRCFRRITANDHEYCDPTSEVTTKQLLALTFLAISDNDEQIRKSNFEDAKEHLVQGLYEIQRGYNLNDSGIDNAFNDSPICAAGTFNKLIEKLQGIHADCEISYITLKTASLKLPRVVKEEVIQYLSELSDPKNEIAIIQKDGLEAIYDKIKHKISDRMFDEFGSVFFYDKDSAEFTGFIDAGKYLEPSDLDLDQFQEQIQSAKQPGSLAMVDSAEVEAGIAEADAVEVKAVAPVYQPHSEPSDSFSFRNYYSSAAIGGLLLGAFAHYSYGVTALSAGYIPLVAITVVLVVHICSLVISNVYSHDLGSKGTVQNPESATDLEAYPTGTPTAAPGTPTAAPETPAVYRIN